MRQLLAVTHDDFTALTAAAHENLAIIITTTDTWTASCAADGSVRGARSPADWLTLHSHEGTGDSVLTFGVSPNLGEARSTTITITTGDGRSAEIAVAQAQRVLTAIRIDGPAVLPVGGNGTYTCTAEYDNGETSLVAPEWTLDGIANDGMVVNDNETAENQIKTLRASFTDNDVTQTAELQITLRRPLVQEFDLKRGWNAVVITLNLLPASRKEMLSQGVFAFDTVIGGYRLVNDESELEPGAMLWLHSRTTGKHAYRADISETAIPEMSAR